MNIRHAFLLAAVLSLAACTQPASPTPEGGPVQHVGGYTLYFGVVPSAIAGKSAGPHAVDARDAHGVTRADYADQHHLLLVAERMRDGVRAENAVVVASVPVAGQTVSRRLAPMRINGAMSYGGVFVLPRAGRYVFTATVRVPGEPAPVVARFVYTRSHDPRP